MQRSPEEMPIAFGRYVVSRVLGLGGFGKVFVAHDPELRRDVAIKTPARLLDDTEIDQFLQEARRLAKLKHPGIVTVYDVGIQDGQCYIVCDLLHGETLREWMTREQPSWQQSVEVVARIAEALTHAHAHGTIHRDVKPGNIMMTGNMEPVLLDFGLALSELDRTDQFGKVAGTPRYMSPEQVRGRAHRIDGRTDIYSLGVVLYEMLCGTPPFRSQNSADLMRQICEDLPQPPRQLAPHLPAELERVCLKAMAKDQSDRFTTAQDFANALRAVVHSYQEPSQPLEGEKTKYDLPSTPAESSGTRRVRREAEKRQVTLLLCNCQVPAGDANSDELIDPEEHQAVVERFYERVETAVRKYDGMILPSAGQEVLVCFGYPIAYEDSPHRAIRAALEIRDEDPDPQVPKCWAAIHTGPVVVGDTAEDTSTEAVSLMGETRNLTARLESIAEPGQVLISGGTYRLVEGFFICQNLGTQRLRGVNTPVTIFQVERATPKRSRFEVAEGTGLTPLVGRDSEVSLLVQRWEQAAESFGQVVLLTGDPGLGKSRLVHVIKDHVRTHSPDSRIIEWRCSPYYQSSGLWPVSEYLQRLLNLDHNDSPKLCLEKLTDYLETIGFDDPTSVSLFASLLGIPAEAGYQKLALSPQRAKERTQELLLDWLRECAATHPVLFVVEDLHWIDPTTLELVHELVDEGHRDSILTLLTFRPEFQPPWRNTTHQTQVALNRLTKRQVVDMMWRKAGTHKIPQSIIDQVVDRTDGVPLFIEEFTKMIVESASARVVDGELEISGSFPAHTIPTTLQDLLIARLDRLEAAKEVAQLAAACGREFSAALLTAVCELPAATLKTQLDQLVEAEILFQRGRGTRSRYIFKHALIQDAAYESILKKKRRAIHLHIGSTLEKNFPEIVEAEPELLAHHFAQAGEPAQAIPYWLKAGQRAQSRCNHREAVSHFHNGLQAVAVLPPGRDRDATELRFQAPLATSLLATKGYAHPEAGAALLRSRELAIATDDTMTLFFVTWGMWARHLLLDELDRCLELGAELLLLAEQSNDPGLEMEALDAPGCTYVHIGNFVEAQNLLERGIALYDENRCRVYARQTGQNSGVVEQVYVSIAIWALGYPDRARNLVHSSVELAKHLDDPFSQVHATNHGAWVHHFCRQADKTIELAEETIRVSSEQAFFFWEACGHISLGAGLVLAGDYRQAIAQVEQGMQAFQSTGARLHLCYALGVLAEAHSKLGDLELAQEKIVRALEAADAANERYVESDLYRIRGDIYLAQGDAHLARQSFEQAIAVAQRQQARSWELRATISLYRLLQNTAEGQQVRQKLHELYSWFKEGFDTRDLSEAWTLLHQD